MAFWEEVSYIRDRKGGRTKASAGVIHMVKVYWTQIMVSVKNPEGD